MTKLKLLNNRVELPIERRGWYWLKSFMCKTDLEEEEAEFQQTMDELTEEYDGDEDIAWDTYCEMQAEARGIWW